MASTTPTATWSAEPPQLVVDKTDHDVDILEAADDIAYDITITNISLTVPLTINSIIDEVTFVPAGGAPESRGTLVVDAERRRRRPVLDRGRAWSPRIATARSARRSRPTAVRPCARSPSTSRATPTTATRTRSPSTPFTTVDQHVTASNEADTPVVNVAPDISIVNDRVAGLGAGDRRSGRLHVDGHQRELRQRRPGDDHGALRQRLRQLLPREHRGGRDRHQLLRSRGRRAPSAWRLGQLHDHGVPVGPGRRRHVDNATVAGIGEEGSRATADDAQTCCSPT